MAAVNAAVALNTDLADGKLSWAPQLRELLGFARVRKTLGHADQAMTSHYTHIEAQAHRAAAEAVAQLVEGDVGYRRT